MISVTARAQLVTLGGQIRPQQLEGLAHAADELLTHLLRARSLRMCERGCQRSKRGIRNERRANTGMTSSLVLTGMH